MREVKDYATIAALANCIIVTQFIEVDGKKIRLCNKVRPYCPCWGKLLPAGDANERECEHDEVRKAYFNS
jgi:hypothetical protein